MQRFMLMAGLLASMACFRADAKDIEVKSDIPFAFQIGDAVMPAGTYEITHHGKVLFMQSEDGRNAAFNVTSPGSHVKQARTGMLIFNRYGGDCFLTEVVGPGQADGRSVPMSKREKELIARSIRTETVIAFVRGR